MKVNPFIYGVQTEKEVKEKEAEIQAERKKQIAKKKVNPIRYIDGRDVNDDTILVITKEEKQYVRFNRLYVTYKGVTITADIDDAISIDTKMDEVHIFRHDQLEPPENREYLLLLVYNDEELEDTYQGILGRQEAFDYITSNADIIDMNKSMILSETTKLKDMWSVLHFVKKCIENDMVKNPNNFDYSGYELIIEDDEEEN